MKDITEREPNLDFDEQFNKKKSIEFTGAPLEFVDIFPIQDIDSIPIFLAPGWAGDKGMFKDVLRSFYKKNRRVLSLNHSTHTKKLQIKTVEPLVEIRKADEILAIIENSDASQVDAVFYSEGGINGILAATKRPEKFRNIILVDPGGFITEDNLFRLIGRFVMEIIRWTKKAIFIPEMRKGLFRIERKVITYVTENPIRTLKEADAIAKEDVIEMLKALHEKGIGTAIIHSNNDKIFPMDRMQKIIDRDMVDHFYPTEGNHFELLVEPRRYVDLIIHALDVEQNKSYQEVGTKSFQQ